MHSASKTLGSRLFRFDLAGLFALAALARYLPELSMRTYPSGWDTVDGYVISILNPLQINLQFLVEAQLVNTILWVVHATTLVNPFVELEIAAPVVYGIFICSFYYMLRRLLKWSLWKAIGSSVFFMMMPVILRLGWDLLRQDVALSMLFILLALSEGELLDGRRSKLTFTLSILIVMTEQLVGILLIVILAWQFFSKVREGNLKITNLIPLIPSCLLFIGVLLGTLGYNIVPDVPSVSLNLGAIGPNVIQIDSQSRSSIPFFVNYYANDPRFASGSYSVVLSYILSLSIWSTLPLIPLAVTGFFKDRVFFPLSIWLLVAGYGIIFSPSLAPEYYWRWILLLPIPLLIFAINGAGKLRLGLKTRQALRCVLLLILAIVFFQYSLYSLPINQQAQSYIPVALSDSALSTSELMAINSEAHYLNNNAPNDSYVITTEAYEGPLKYDLRTDMNLIVFPLGSTMQTALQSTPFENGTSSDVYLVWGSNETEVSQLTIITQNMSIVLFKVS